MSKRMSVVICGLAVMLAAAGPPLAQGDAAADAATTAAVKTKLLADTKVGGLAIDVDTKDNVVTLSGKVKSAAEKTEAARLARTTTGVKGVVNHLVVDPAYKGVTDKDDKAKAEAKEAAEKTKGTTGKAVDATKEGAKKTGNAIETGAKKTGDAIETGAKKTADESKKVGSKVGEEITDDSITTAVKTKFLADSKVAGLKINVDTDKHVVTLTGTVKSAAEKAEAIRLAKTTTGVHKVVDKLTIQQ